MRLGPELMKRYPRLNINTVKDSLKHELWYREYVASECLSVRRVRLSMARRAPGP